LFGNYRHFSRQRVVKTDHREKYYEFRSCAVITLDGYGTVVLSYQLVADSQAEPGTLSLGGKKWRKNLVQYLLGNAGTGIGNADPDPFPITPVDPVGPD
jgi:hypothetical protein